MACVDIIEAEPCGRSRSHTGESTIVADMSNRGEKDGGGGGGGTGADSLIIEDKAEEAGLPDSAEASPVANKFSTLLPPQPASSAEVAAVGSTTPPVGPTEEPEPDPDDEPYPEGGLRAWLVVAGSWLALFSSLGLMNTMATFQTYVMTHQLAGYSEGTIGWIFSVYAFLCFFCGIYIGPVFDKYGPRWLVLAGSVCLVASILLMSICTGMDFSPWPTCVLGHICQATLVFPVLC